MNARLHQQWGSAAEAVVETTRILIVDDNRAIHDDFRKLLQGAPAGVCALAALEAEVYAEAPPPSAVERFEIDSAFQGHKALERVERALAEGRPYALAFVDVCMPPGWSGVETIRRLWQADPHLQVAVCTACSDAAWQDLAGSLPRRDNLVILKKPFDVNLAVRNALTVSRQVYRYVAELHLELAELPAVRCHVGDLNQVLLHLIVNAGQAIAERHGGRRGGLGRLEVRTYRDGGDVIIAVGDDGPGIPEAVRERIFDPFFTTKPVGRATGQGLAIARSIVVDRHEGQLTFDTEVGRGTTFFVRVPIAGPRRSRPEPPT